MDKTEIYNAIACVSDLLKDEAMKSNSENIAGLISALVVLERELND